MKGPGPAEYPVGGISNVIKHDELFENYPDLAGIRARLKRGDSGAYFPNNRFNVSLDIPAMFKNGNYSTPERTASTTLHELQHAIQQREGFARGGSVAEFAPGPMFDAKAKDLSFDLGQLLTGSGASKPSEVITAIKYGDPSKVSAIVKKYGFGSTDEAVSFLAAQDAKRTPMGQYRRLAGEAEARLTQSRMNMSPIQRAASYPPSMFDVPIDQQIVRRK